MGGGGGEGGGERARARPHLQLVRVLARHACAGRGGATAWTGRGDPGGALADQNLSSPILIYGQEVGRALGERGVKILVDNTEYIDSSSLSTPRRSRRG